MPIHLTVSNRRIIITGMSILSFCILELEATLLVMAWIATVLAIITSGSVSVALE
jgi:hypothetical protein